MVKTKLNTKHAIKLDDQSTKRVDSLVSVSLFDVK